MKNSSYLFYLYSLICYPGFLIKKLLDFDIHERSIINCSKISAIILVSLVNCIDFIQL